MPRRPPSLCNPEPVAPSARAVLRVALLAALASAVALAACGSDPGAAAGAGGARVVPPPADIGHLGAGGAGGAPLVVHTPQVAPDGGVGGYGGAPSTSASTASSVGASSATASSSASASSASSSSIASSSAATSSASVTTGVTTGGGEGSSSSSSGGGGACDTVVSFVDTMPTTHVPTCSTVTYNSNPPTSGNHYSSWAAYKIYTQPVPRGFYVHDLEHGAIVVTYNCPSGCDADLAALYAFLATLPQDPICLPPLKNRIVVTPDPKLDVPFAASAWNWMLKSSCFDLAALGPFITAHYGHGGEDWCADGYDVTTDSGIPDTCGD